jgi:hypothetical protein
MSNGPCALPPTKTRKEKMKKFDGHTDAFGLLWQRSDCYAVEAIEGMLAAGEHVLAHEARTRLHDEIEARAATVIIERHEHEVRAIVNSYLGNLSEYVT